MEDVRSSSSKDQNDIPADGRQVAEPSTEVDAEQDLSKFSERGDQAEQSAYEGDGLYSEGEFGGDPTGTA